MTSHGKPLMNVTEEQVEQVRQDLADCHVASSYLELNPEAVAILRTVCTEWLRNEQALRQDYEVDATCTECGTLYDTSDGACPVCGSQDTE